MARTYSRDTQSEERYYVALGAEGFYVVDRETNEARGIWHARFKARTEAERLNALKP
jgi:hypothetical protein